MAWAPNLSPQYSAGITRIPATPLLLTAKTVMTDNSNAKLVLSADGAYRRVFPGLFIQPAGAVAACKAWLLSSFTPGGTVLAVEDELVIPSQTGFSTTVGGTLIQFTRWSASNPFTLLETQDLWVAFSVAQTVAHLFQASSGGRLY